MKGVKMIKPGQVYKQKSKPFWRKDESDMFVVTSIGYGVDIVDSNGITSKVGYDWINGDCELINEYENWMDALSSLRII